MILRLALRNVARNGRRTFLTASGTALALWMTMVSSAIDAGSWATTVSSAIRGTAGHVVVQHPAWQADRRPEDAVLHSDVVADALRSVWPDTTVTRRVWLGGLLSSPRNSVSVSIQGVEPEREAAVGTLDDRLAAGAWLDAPGRIVIGDGVAERLGVGVGDKVVLLVQVGDLQMQSLLLRVGGITHAGTERLDQLGAVARLDDVADLIPGASPAHQIAVILPPGDDRALDSRLARVAAGSAAVLSWREALPLLEEQGDLKQSFSSLMYGFMAVIVGIGVTNTVLMSVMERLREFGVLRAVGMRAGALFRLILLEGALVGALGAGVGLALATPTILVLRDRGLDFGGALAASSPVATVPGERMLYAAFEPWTLTAFALASVAVAVLASVWPAWKARSLRPVDALTHP